MNLSFGVKVPIKERLRILWRGGLMVEFSYRGQFGVSNIKVSPVFAREVDAAYKSKDDENHKP